ncbi:GSCOCT00003767001.3-RA-CDS [Cotesia congregata]|uniref:Chemosensory protein 15.3767 n=1 Tax=Cotesia congregata TaxID=51543 RepID=A0A8J2MSJ1_COTCN|nr:GSCOCT00003767001.3-RA-CDS [Cotesia congregata]CAG5107318.1 Chemosensory protein 15.3767 [Cotesia congregata]
MVHFVKIIRLIIAGMSFKLNIETYEDRIESEIKHDFISRFFCVLGADEFCDAFGERIKFNMVDLLENQCSKCSLQMQAIGSRAIPYLKDQFPDLWILLVKKYQKKENSMESYFLSAYECLIEDLNCNSSFELLKKALPVILKLKFIPGEKDVTVLLGQQLRLVEKKFPFVYQELLDKFKVS